MNDQDIIRRTLVECLPDECNAVGPSAVNDVVLMRTTFEQPREGRSFPLHEVLAELAAAATLIRAAVEWAPKLRAALGRKPTASEVMNQTGDCGVEQQRAEQVINKVLDA